MAQRATWRDTWLKARKTEIDRDRRFWRRIEAGRDSLAFCTPQSKIKKILPSMGRTV